MFITNYYVIFNFFLIAFSIFTLNFRSLFFTWIFIELNLLIVVPLLLMKRNFIKEQGSLILKYFLIQVIGSIFILVTISFIDFSFSSLNYFNTRLIVVLMLKSGTPPLHFWFPQIIGMTNPCQAFILLCVQKIIPLFLIGALISELILIFIIISRIIGRISGLNQNSLIKILAYSSLTHSRWMITGIFIKFLSGYFYFLVYSAITYFFTKILNNSKIKFVSEIICNNKNLISNISFILFIFTLSGTPPFVGFFRKIYILFRALERKLLLISIFLILGSTFSFFFYARLIILRSLFSQLNIKNIFLNKRKLNIIYPIFFNIVFFIVLALIE